MSCAPGEPRKGYGSCAVSMRSVAAVSLGSIYIMYICSVVQSDVVHMYSFFKCETTDRLK